MPNPVPRGVNLRGNTDNNYRVRRDKRATRRKQNALNKSFGNRQTNSGRLRIRTSPNRAPPSRKRNNDYFNLEGMNPLLYTGTEYPGIPNHPPPGRPHYPPPDRGSLFSYQVPIKNK